MRMCPELMPGAVLGSDVRSSDARGGKFRRALPLTKHGGTADAPHTVVDSCEIQFAPPKKPWNEDSACKYQQWFQPWFQSGAK